MREKLYTVGFTVILCGLSALVVTAANVHWKGAYEAHTAAEKMKAVLGAFGLLGKEEPDPQAVGTMFQKYIRVSSGESIATYEAVKDGVLLGYALEVGGRGLFGPIRGILAFEPDRRTIRGLRFYEQEETPGLGGQVSSLGFVEQFRGKRIVGPGGEPAIRIVRGASGPNEVDAITGATLTSRAVERFLNRNIGEFLSGQKLVPLELELPQALFVGSFSVPPGSTAEVPSTEARQPFFAPVGTRNVSRGKPVSASDEEPIVGELSMVTDGDKEAAEWSYVELGFGLQYVQIDLEAVYEIYALLIWHYHGDARIYRDVVVQVADDADFTTNVRTLFNNDYDDSSGLGIGGDTEYFETYEGKLIEVDGTRARYVRIYGNGSTADDFNRFTEVEVFGRPG